MDRRAAGAKQADLDPRGRGGLVMKPAFEPAGAAMPLAQRPRYLLQQPVQGVVEESLLGRILERTTRLHLGQEAMRHDQFRQASQDLVEPLENQAAKPAR